MNEKIKERIEFYRERIKQIDTLYPSVTNFYVVPAESEKQDGTFLASNSKEGIESPKRVVSSFLSKFAKDEQKEYLGSLSEEELKEFNPDSIPVSVIEERNLLTSLIDKINNCYSANGFKTSDGLSFSGQYGQVYEWQLSRLTELMNQDKDINAEAYEQAGGEKKYEEVIKSREERQAKIDAIGRRKYEEEKAAKERNAAKLDSLKAKRDALLKKKSLFGKKKRAEEIAMLNVEIENFGSGKTL